MRRVHLQPSPEIKTNGFKCETFFAHSLYIVPNSRKWKKKWDFASSMNWDHIKFVELIWVRKVEGMKTEASWFYFSNSLEPCTFSDTYLSSYFYFFPCVSSFIVWRLETWICSMLPKMWELNHWFSSNTFMLVCSTLAVKLRLADSCYWLWRNDDRSPLVRHNTASETEILWSSSLQTQERH